MSKKTPVGHAHAPETTAKEQKEFSEKQQAISASNACVYMYVYVGATVTVTQNHLTGILSALTFVDVERNGSDCDADHALRVVEELNGLGVQGKIVSVLCERDRVVN